MHRDWVKGGGSAKGNFWLDSALDNRHNRKPDPRLNAIASLLKRARQVFMGYLSGLS